MTPVTSCPGTHPKDERVCCFPSCECADKKLGLCLTGQCDCANAAACKFKRCSNCDMPVDDAGKALQMDVYGPGGPFMRYGDDEWPDCPECGGPLPKP